MYKNMQAIILSLHTPSAPRMGTKGQNSFFLKVVTVMLLIKLKGMKCHASIYLPLHTNSTPRWGLTFFSSKVVMLHIEWTERFVMYI